MTGFKDHFSERAPGYATFRPHYPAELAAWLGSVAPRKELAWDAACGSGQLSTLLGDHFRKVVATDASDAQVSEAAHHPNVEYRVEPAESSSLAERSADLVTVAQGAHWLNLAAFYKEAQRVGRDGSPIALIAYERTRIEPAVDAIVEAFYSGELEPWWPPERKHIETGYRDLAFPFERIEAPQLEMKASWTADQLLGYIRTWSAVRAMERENGPAATDRFAAEVRRVWRSGAKSVSWPIFVLAGRIRG
ncbi:MAG TPA: class I SAM-dependent methyltransferase [Gemmatimonadaceae bacterium]|nr:class I SAM-dependent methyltransferase [Gemmatimonadaceae bacterium]